MRRWGGGVIEGGGDLQKLINGSISREVESMGYAMPTSNQTMQMKYAQPQRT